MEHGPPDTAERLALAALCDELRELRRECAVQTEEKRLLLSRIEAEARERRPILALLDQLLGTSGADTVRGLSSGLPGAGSGRADEETFACPDGACDRVVHAVPAGPIPRCELTGLPLISR
ncbi:MULTISPECIES: hypothetical protein [Streptomyces]|uniref:hypothetical protein n=1 Tax=Streptomyces malaysiensis TaxID=92644 RepID=UPI000C2C9A70|nr:MULTISPECIES: hypothetical protein [Streptomyces]AUA08330.1 hypothetical protein CFP59_00415 [Streptomyces sp. M56]MYX55088.1 hypothetical protein [Streptomyces sp. SID8382]